MFYVYAIYSLNSNKFYIGFTSDLEARLYSHNHISNKGWTAKYKPWILIYHETLNNKQDALKREKQLTQI